MAQLNVESNVESNNKDIFKIQLCGKNPNAANSFALISVDKVQKVIEHKWYLGKNGYPFTYIKGGRVQLHKYIWYLCNGSVPDKMIYIDHINRNKLDATNTNLRLSTPAENSYNKTSTSKTIDPTTGKPLHHIKLTKKGYKVSISKNGLTNSIDNIASLEEAKEIYNMMATEMFGEFAVCY